MAMMGPQGLILAPAPAVADRSVRITHRPVGAALASLVPTVILALASPRSSLLACRSRSR